MMFAWNHVLVVAVGVFLILGLIGGGAKFAWKTIIAIALLPILGFCLFWTAVVVMALWDGPPNISVN